MAYFFNGILSLFNLLACKQSHIILGDGNAKGNQNYNYVSNPLNSSINNRQNSNEIPRGNSSESILPTTIAEANVFVLFEYPENPNFIPIKREIEIDNSSKGLCVELPQHIEFKSSPDDAKLKLFYKNKWEFIKKCLTKHLNNKRDLNGLENVIKSYNSDLRDSHFDVLDKLSTKDRKLIPKIIGLALRLTEIVPEAIPLLHQKTNKILFISQHQISCLLANAFLCTFPEPKPLFPYINFNNLFVSNGRFDESKVKLEKLKCILNYFRRVISDPPKGEKLFFVNFKFYTYSTYNELYFTMITHEVPKAFWESVYIFEKYSLR
jgi:hypothetical protein